MSLNKNLTQAKRNKNDEFYTQLSDIENELRHYREHFAGKTVYCNCDDPRVSNFYRYFARNFEHLGLKKLLASCYRNEDPDLFSPSGSESEKAVWIEYAGHREGERMPRDEDAEVRPLEGAGADGDFRKAASIALLKQADIVVTNPPFSMFREYVAQLVEHGKKFLIIGNMNAATYKEVFPLIKDNRLWYGPSISSGDREFGVPAEYPLTAATSRVDEHGNKFIRVKGVRWFTNLDHSKRHEPLPLYKRYTPEEYPKYDNYDAINVNKTAEIPMDYEGVMGVPISFLDKHCPEQFEIVGSCESNDRTNDCRTRWYTSQECRNAYFDRFGKNGVYDLNASCVVDGVKKFKRILIRNLNPEVPR